MYIYTLCIIYTHFMSICYANLFSMIYLYFIDLINLSGLIMFIADYVRCTLRIVLIAKNSLPVQQKSSIFNEESIKVWNMNFKEADAHERVPFTAIRHQQLYPYSRIEARGLLMLPPNFIRRMFVREYFCDCFTWWAFRFDLLTTRRSTRDTRTL